MLMISIMSISAFARKEYVTLYSTMPSNTSTYPGHYMYLYGDLPDGMKSQYKGEDKKSEVDIIKMLTENGYELEYLVPTTYSSSYIYYLFSKTSSQDDGNTSNLPTIRDDAEDVYEIARYNLQGIPVDKKYKGIQIIVYSNYTTKTFIQE